MKIRLNYQIACPACHAHTGQPCTNAQGQRLPGVHFQRSTALRRATMEAFKSLYAPLTALPPR